MDLDEWINTLSALKQRNAANALAELTQAMASPGALSQDQMILAAYISGVEDAITGTAGRPEYDLRLFEFRQRAKGTVSDTGRNIGDLALADYLQQAIGE